jgi:regulator of sirC expression with transglutaminase-like and TPR domain
VSTTEIEALMLLLLDDDAKIRDAVARRFEDLGHDGLEALRGARDAEDARIRLRARLMLWRLDSERVARALEEHLGGKADLERASVLLARVERPDLDELLLRVELDRLGEGVREAIRGCRSAAERARTLGSVLHDREGFSGDVEIFDDPRNTYLNDVLDRRIGIPISLSLVYILVGRRAGLPVRGVGMPLHFLVALEDEQGQRLLVDPYGGGRLMSRESCRTMLAGYHHAFREDYLRPVQDRHMLRRMIANLIRVYDGRKDKLRLGRLYRFVNLLQDRRPDVSHE